MTAKILTPLVFMALCAAPASATAQTAGSISNADVSAWLHSLGQDSTSQEDGPEIRRWVLRLGVTTALLHSHTDTTTGMVDDMRISAGWNNLRRFDAFTANEWNSQYRFLKVFYDTYDSSAVAELDIPKAALTSTAVVENYLELFDTSTSSLTEFLSMVEGRPNPKKKNDAAKETKEIPAFSKIPTNKKVFSVPESATDTAKGKRSNAYSVFFDPTDWQPAPPEGADADLSFNNDAFGMMALSVHESAYLPLETMRKLVVRDLRQTLPDLTIKTEEFRMVNKKKMLYMELIGTTKESMVMNYTLLLYSAEKFGSLQWFVISIDDLKQQAEEVVAKMSNGLVIHTK